MGGTNTCSREEMEQRGVRWVSLGEVLGVGGKASSGLDDVLGLVEVCVCWRHFESAMGRVRPSVSENDVRRYEQMRIQFASPMRLAKT